MNRALRSATVLLALALALMAAWPMSALAADSLNMRTAGRWPFGGESVAVGDETRQLVFCGSSGGVYVLDASNPESLRVVSERIQTRGIVRDLFYDAANFRLYVACLEGGLEIWDVATPTSPSRLGAFAAATRACAVVVSGGSAFVADRDSGLRIVNVTDPANPYQAARLETPVSAFDVAVQGSYAYIADSSSVRVVDVSTPSDPREVGHCDTIWATAIAASGQYAYVTGAGLQVLNVADPARPYKMGFCPVPSWAVDVAVTGSYAYVSDHSYGLIVIDVSNPQSPTRVNSLLSLGRATVRVSGTHAYAIAFELAVLDITAPRSPAVLGTFVAPKSVYGGVAVSGNYAYETDDYQGILVIDVSDPTATREVARCDSIGGTMSVVVRGRYAYTGNLSSGVGVIDISDPMRPSQIGHCGIGGTPQERMALHDTLLCVAGQMIVPVVNIADPTRPFRVGVYDNPGFAYSVAVLDSWMYVADAWEGTQVVALSDPANPVEVGRLTGPALDVALLNGYVLVAASGDGLRVVDVTDAQSPREVGRCATPSDVYCVAVSPPYAYVACDSGGIRIIDVSDPTNPREAGYYTDVEAVGSIALQGDLVYVAAGGTNLNIFENTLYGIVDASPKPVGASGVRLLENPARNGLLRLAIPPSVAGAVKLGVFDVSGRCMLERRTQKCGGCSRFAVRVGTLPAGAYVARVTLPDGEQLVKFTIVAGGR